MNLSDYGSAAKPLRPSQVDKLVKCSVQAVLLMLEPEDTLGGKAAQTGSAVHAAVAAYHTEPVADRKVQAGLDAIQLGLPTFPDAEVADAKRSYLLYAADPRNATARLVAVEKKVRLELPPHPTDRTGQPVVFEGTTDQLRYDPSNRLTVCDIKTGAPSGWQMLHDYAYQMAAYTLAARASGFPDTVPGAIIRTAGYRTRTAVLPSPDGVFFWQPFTVDDCYFLLERVQYEVARVRAGEVLFGPGVQCTYCPIGGLQSCLPVARRKLGI